MILLRAQFIGTDSLGFHRGTEYVIRVRSQHTYTLDSIKLYRKRNLVVEEYGIQATKFCPYDSFEMFINNWNILSKLEYKNETPSWINHDIIAYFRHKN